MFKLSPSDFAFLYEECKLCYWLKVKHNIFQPSMPMPGVFSAINIRLQGTLVGKDLKVLSSKLPEGKVVVQEGWVESKPVPGTQVYIKGKYDLLVKRPDGTFCLVDLKISQPHEDKITKYQTQLAAYQYALQNPAHGQTYKVSKLGLLVFYPDKVAFKNETTYVEFPPKWLEIPSDEPGFFKFAKEVEELLTGPMPEEGKNCKWCQYRHTGEKLAHKEEEPEQVEIPF